MRRLASARRARAVLVLADEVGAFGFENADDPEGDAFDADRFADRIGGGKEVIDQRHADDGGENHQNQRQQDAQHMGDLDKNRNLNVNIEKESNKRYPAHWHLLCGRCLLAPV